jgi:DNA-binding MarR family transcriptional regulator
LDSQLKDEDYRALAKFRFQIRRFLHFSEEATRSEGLESQQHQLLLAIRASADLSGPTVGELAEQLWIRHHSAVGLADRLMQRGLVERVRGADDRRQVRIRLTPAGDSILARLSSVHRTELLKSGPLLVESLAALLQRPHDKDDDVPKV